MSGILRTSERRDFKRCQQRWWWSWREGLKSRGSEKDVLWFGTGIHLALAEWYCGPKTKRGPHPAETWEKYAAEQMRYAKLEKVVNDDIETAMADMRTLGRVMMEEYVKTYGRDEHKLIINPEQTFNLPIPWPKQSLYEVPEGDILTEYCGTYDGTWRDAETGWLWLDEHKTAKAISTKHLSLDDQAGSYWAMATRTLRARGLIGPKEALRGIEYNFMKKALPDTRPKNADGHYTNKPVKADYITALQRVNADISTGIDLSKKSLLFLQTMAEEFKLEVLGEVSKVQPGPLFVREQVHRTSKERATQLRRIQAESLQMRVLKDGLLPLTKNSTRDCNWDCNFFEMCELQERSGNWEELRELQYRVEDPYADHRATTEE